MRVHFVNENVGGHAMMHHAIRGALAGDPGVDATFFDVPPPSLGRRVLSAHVPGVPRDYDLQPLRDQLAKSAVVRRHLRRLAPRPDALHVYTHNVALLSADLLRAGPSVVSLDATNLQNAYRLPQGRATRATPVVAGVAARLERRVYRSATIVVAQSEWAAESLRSDYGVPEDRLRVIPFGILVPPLAPPAPDPGLPRITFVARSMERKGGWRLLNIWRGHLQARCRLTLVTPEPVPPAPGLEVIGTIRPGDGQLPAVLARTSVFAAPTEMDTFGYAAMEAMAAGVAVVSTRTAAIPEVVDEGVTGLLTEPGDDDELLAALTRLLDDAELRQSMGRAGRARVLERFDAHITTAALVKVLREAVDRAPARP